MQTLSQDRVERQERAELQFSLTGLERSLRSVNRWLPTTLAADQRRLAGVCLYEGAPSVEDRIFELAG